MARPSRRHEVSTSWDEIGWVEAQPGQFVSRVVVGDEGDPQAAHIFHGVFPPDCVVDPHTHESDYCEIILEGTQRVGKHWYCAGDIRIVKGGTIYGPLVAGPEGCRVLVIFSDARWQPVRVKEGREHGLMYDFAPDAATPVDNVVGQA